MWRRIVTWFKLRCAEIDLANHEWLEKIAGEDTLYWKELKAKLEAAQREYWKCRM